MEWWTYFHAVRFQPWSYPSSTLKDFLMVLRLLPLAGVMAGDCKLPCLHGWDSQLWALDSETWTKTPSGPMHLQLKIAKYCQSKDSNIHFWHETMSNAEYCNMLQTGMHQSYHYESHLAQPRLPRLPAFWNHGDQAWRPSGCLGGWCINPPVGPIQWPIGQVAQPWFSGASVHEPCPTNILYDIIYASWLPNEYALYVWSKLELSCVLMLFNQDSPFDPGKLSKWTCLFWSRQHRFG